MCTAQTFTSIYVHYIEKKNNKTINNFKDYGGVYKRASVVRCKCTNMTKLRIACTYLYLYILQCLPLENILGCSWTLSNFNNISNASKICYLNQSYNSQ